jgi:hypothetical protein
MQCTNQQRQAKVSQEGKFTPFPGTTVVSFFIDPKDGNRPLSLERFYDWIVKTQKVFTSYYAMLPPSCYHMTIKNISHAPPTGTQSIDWFEKHFVPNFAKYQAIKDACGRCIEPITTQVVSPYFGDTFGILLAIESEDEDNNNGGGKSQARVRDLPLRKSYGSLLPLSPSRPIDLGEGPFRGESLVRAVFSNSPITHKNHVLKPVERVEAL